MAEEESEEKEGTEETPEESGGLIAKLGKKKLLIIGGGVAALFLLIGTPLAVFLLMGEEKPETEQEQTTAAIEKQDLVLMMEGFEEEDQSTENEKPLGAFYPFETFVVNLKGGGYLRCEAQAEFTERDIPKKFFAKLIPIRDELISALSGKTRGDLAAEKGRAELKQHMKEIINGKLRKEQVEKIYFTEFIIQ
jgi:flagellar basal body-associated protein FliL